jgi:hypothetical protein
VSPGSKEGVGKEKKGGAWGVNRDQRKHSMACCCEELCGSPKELKKIMEDCRQRHVRKTTKKNLRKGPAWNKRSHFVPHTVQH